MKLKLLLFNRTFLWQYCILATTVNSGGQLILVHPSHIKLSSHCKFSPWTHLAVVEKELESLKGNS